MITAKCENCIFWKETEDGKGECRKHAPQMLSGVGEGFSNQLWPITKDSDWCGDFQDGDAE